MFKSIFDINYLLFILNYCVSVVACFENYYIAIIIGVSVGYIVLFSKRQILKIGKLILAGGAVRAGERIVDGIIGGSNVSPPKGAKGVGGNNNGGSSNNDSKIGSNIDSNLDSSSDSKTK
jgi:hypothetical protein